MEGERLPTAVAHLEGCARCRGLIAELEGIENAASELPAAEPPARVWMALRNQLEAEGLIRQPLLPEPHQNYVHGQPMQPGGKGGLAAEGLDLAE